MVEGMEKMVPRFIFPGRRRPGSPVPHPRQTLQWNSRPSAELPISIFISIFTFTSQGVGAEMMQSFLGLYDKTPSLKQEVERTKEETFACHL